MLLLKTAKQQGGIGWYVCAAVSTKAAMNDRRGLIFLNTYTLSLSTCSCGIYVLLFLSSCSWFDVVDLCGGMHAIYTGGQTRDTSHLKFGNRTHASLDSSMSYDTTGVHSIVLLCLETAKYCRAVAAQQCSHAVVRNFCCAHANNEQLQRQQQGTFTTSCHVMVM